MDEITPARDERGRWLPGVSGDPTGGSAYRMRIRAARSTILNAIRQDDWADMVFAQIQKAKEGDTDAFRALTTLLPKEVELGGQDDNPLLPPDMVLVAILEARRRLSSGQNLAIESDPPEGGTHP
jgi:hypothetical protein